MVNRKKSYVKSFSLAINTSSSIESVALLSGKKLVAEKLWKGNFDESEKLLPNILFALKKADISFNNISRIIVVKGPGPFSALRIGVTVAHMLSFILKIPTYSIDSQTLWRFRQPNKDAILLLHAGGNFVFRSGGGFPEGIFSIENALRHSEYRRSGMKNLGILRFAQDDTVNRLVFYGDITEAEMTIFKKLKKKNWRFIPENRLKTFGESIFTIQSSLIKRERIVTPLYWKPPNITSPKA